MFHKINMSFFSSWSDLKSVFTPFVDIISFSPVFFFIYARFGVVSVTKVMWFFFFSGIPN